MASSTERSRASRERKAKECAEALSVKAQFERAVDAYVTKGYVTADDLGIDQTGDSTPAADDYATPEPVVLRNGWGETVWSQAVDVTPTAAGELEVPGDDRVYDEYVRHRFIAVAWLALAVAATMAAVAAFVVAVHRHDMPLATATAVLALVLAGVAVWRLDRAV